jgi:hypothetical protein
VRRQSRALQREAAPCAQQISRSARRAATNLFAKYGPKLEKSGEEVFSFPPYAHNANFAKSNQLELCAFSCFGANFKWNVLTWAADKRGREKE